MADPRGSDVRLIPGQLFESRAWPRQPIPTGTWSWHTVQSYSFKHADHINLLEERAFLNYLRRRSLLGHRFRSRFLVVFDSQIVSAVTSKARSSSVRLNRLLRRCAALQLACGFYPFCGWTRSEDNPADAPSRAYE